MSRTPTPQQGARRDWMGTLAKACPGQLAALMPVLPEHQVLRTPEIGTVMVQGRIGGTGAGFNLGEMTVTRASVRLVSGAVGHAMVQGRDKAHATRAALADALLQGPEAEETETRILAPLRADAEARKTTRAEKAAATRVEFFTLVRGEDQ